MSAVIANTPFQPGYRLIDGTDLNKAINYPVCASQDGITATASGTQATAYQLTAYLSRVTTVATGADAVALPPAVPGLEVSVINSGANSMQVFGNYAAGDTINGVATATGIAQAAGTTFTYTCSTQGKWIQNGANAGGYTGTFDGVLGGNTPAAATTTTLKASSKITYTGVRVGTFVCNGATPVTVTNANVTANSMIFVSLNTVGGTVGAIPAVKTITAATGFTVAGTASDTSTYNYCIIEAA